MKPIFSSLHLWSARFRHGPFSLNDQWCYWAFRSPLEWGRPPRVWSFWCASLRERTRRVSSWTRAAHRWWACSSSLQAAPLTTIGLPQAQHEATFSADWLFRSTTISKLIEDEWNTGLLPPLISPKGIGDKDSLNQCLSHHSEKIGARWGKQKLLHCIFLTYIQEFTKD